MSVKLVADFIKATVPEGPISRFRRMRDRCTPRLPFVTEEQKRMRSRCAGCERSIRWTSCNIFAVRAAGVKSGRLKVTRRHARLMNT